jgi:hypothetical protein
MSCVSCGAYEGNVVLESGTMDFPDARSSLSSPLAKSLFTVTGVQRVFFGNDFITVTKKPDVEWHEIKVTRASSFSPPRSLRHRRAVLTPAATTRPTTRHILQAQIFANIMDFYASGESVVSEQQDTSNTTILPTGTQTRHDTQRHTRHTALDISHSTTDRVDSETVAMIKELLEVRIRPSVQEDGGDIEYDCAALSQFSCAGNTPIEPTLTRHTRCARLVFAGTRASTRRPGWCI